MEAIALVVSFALTSALSPTWRRTLAKSFHRAWDALTLSLKFAVLFQLSLYFLCCCIALAKPFFPSDPVIELTQHYLWIMPLPTVATARW